MRVLHINSYYGAGKFYKNLYDQQIKNQLEISVFVSVANDFNEENFNYGDYTTISKNYSKFDRIAFHVKHNKIYKDIVRNYDINTFSVIHAHSLFSNGSIAMRLKLRFGIPYIVAVRNTDVNLFFRKMIHLRKLGLKILENADKIIFLSEAYRDQVIDKYIPENLKETIYNKVSVIPNGIDDFWIENHAKPKAKPNLSTLRLLQIGDINKNKNIETTVKAIDILIENGYDVEFDVVGKVKEKVVFNKINALSYVNYLGYKTKEELIDVYNKNDIFILPSINETFGLVYPEAMSQGLPIIYTKKQGFDGQFEDGIVGYSVNCCDPMDIYEKIIEIIAKFDEISNSCVNNINKFSWETISNDYREIYFKVIKIF